MANHRGPIPQTCPDIDRQQAKNNAAIKDINSALKWVEDTDTKRLLGELYDRLDANNDFLEDMRKSNDALRTWGAEMEDKAVSLEAELSQLQPA